MWVEVKLDKYSDFGVYWLAERKSVFWSLNAVKESISRSAKQNYSLESTTKGKIFGSSTDNSRLNKNSL